MPRTRADLVPVISGLSERLVEFRRTLGLSQREMAEKLGLPFRSVQDYEGGISTPGGHALLAFYRVGASVDWLLDGKIKEDGSSEVAASSARLESSDEFEVRLPKASTRRPIIVLPRGFFRGVDANAKVAGFINADDAMAPQLRKGTLAIFLKKRILPVRPGLYAFESDKGLGVRRIISRQNGSLVIRNSNKEWPEERVKEKAWGSVIGWLQVP